MNRQERYRWRWAGALLLLPVLLLILGVGCSGDEEVDEPRLNIYVYAPERPVVTRGEIIPSEEEAQIYNLQIWVFRSSDPSKMVASLTLSTEEELRSLNDNKSASYSIALADRSFAEKPEPVDIYVLANVLDNNGTNYFDTVNNSEDLETAVFNGGHFFSYLKGSAYQAATTVPADKGVPMSGVARGKSVIDRNNVLHISDANLKLARTVSKIRFAFSSLNEPGLSQLFIEKITLNNKMMYQKERFFLDGDHPSYWVEGAPFDQEVLLIQGDRVNPVMQNSDPASYAYSSAMSDEEYEDLINRGVKEGLLTEKGPVYLPESDKRLSGTIYFRLGSGGPQMSVPFSMASGNFRRNQTWLVYAYYIGSSKLEVNTVSVVDWEDVGDQPNYEIPNW
ncbi:MAG: hypothetical protein IJV25_07235 [Prevotella sp.]|nr:hypothetical protein [Prevotella sp.]